MSDAQRENPPAGSGREDARGRLVRGAGALALLGALALGTRFLVGESSADLENPGRDAEPRVFASQRDRIRMVVPRQWQATDQPTYPGVILWMMRNQPPAQVALTSEAFTRELYCSWPSQCRAMREPLTGQLACALRGKLSAQRFRVGPTQPESKKKEAAGLPSALFEYDDGKRFLRHAVALTADRVFSLVLSAPSVDARAAHERSFDQMLRTLRTLGPDEAAPEASAGTPAQPAAPAAPATTTTSDAATSDATRATTVTPDAAAPLDAAIPPDAATPPDAAVRDAGVTFESAPPPKIVPVGPCPS